MSLFGTSPESPSRPDSAQKTKTSLFADEPSQSGGANSTSASASLFADDGPAGAGSSTMNSNKRAARHELVKTLLPGSDVPESYIEAYDLVLGEGDATASGVGLTAVREVLAGSGLSAMDQDRVFGLVSSGDGIGDEDGDGANGLGRSEFNVLLALVGLAQEGEELTFDAVDDRRTSEFCFVSLHWDGF